MSPVTEDFLLEVNDEIVECDAPSFSFDVMVAPITNEKAKDAGLTLTDDHCIDLVFLLVDNPGHAYQLCKKIEDGTLRSGSQQLTNGQFLMLALVNTGRVKNLDRWDLKIVCALHLIEHYQAVRILAEYFGFSYEQMKKKFEKIEHHFIQPARVALFRLCEDLTSADSEALLENLQARGWKHTETALLALEEKKGISDLVSCINSAGRSVHLNGSVPVVSNMARDVKTVKKGLCLIISQRNFIDGHSVRVGTEKDVKSLKEVWEKFGCQVFVEEDLDHVGMRRKVEWFRDEIERTPAEDLDYVVCAVMTHGRENKDTYQEELMGINGRGVETRELLSILSNGHQCPKLVGKPKIFIIQACRGEETMAVMKEVSSKNEKDIGKDGHEEEKPKRDLSKPRYLPMESWNLIAYSTLKGYTSFRKKSEGSFFIQSLCSQLKQLGHVLDVTRIVQSATGIIHQITPNMSPTFECSFGDDVYLTPDEGYADTTEDTVM